MAWLYRIVALVTLAISIGLAFSQYQSAKQKFYVDELPGTVDDCCIEVDTLDSLNTQSLFDVLSTLSSSKFFRYFRVNYERECPFWQEDYLCSASGPTDCSICPCPDDELPEAWRRDREQNNEQRKQHRSNLKDFDLVACATAEDTRHLGKEKHLWLDSDDGDCYINLEANPERYTGYGGFNATRIWMAIYKENCFTEAESECLEGRVFYRLISGFHASTTAHITEYFTSSTNVWQPNVDMFVWRLGLFPDRLKNIYFAFAFLLRAAIKAEAQLRSFDYSTGDSEADAIARRKINELLDAVKSLKADKIFDESLMFHEERMSLKDEFRTKFRNISRIIDCTGCETCKVHAKLQLLGMGTALRILVDSPDPDAIELQRNEVLAFVNTLQKFSDSIRITQTMRARAHRRAIDVGARSFAVGVLVMFFLCLMPGFIEGLVGVDSAAGKKRQAHSTSTTTAAAGATKPKQQ